MRPCSAVSSAGLKNDFILVFKLNSDKLHLIIYGFASVVFKLFLGSSGKTVFVVLKHFVLR